MAVGANVGCVSAGRSGEGVFAGLDMPASSLSGVQNLTLGL